MRQPCWLLQPPLRVSVALFYVNMRWLEPLVAEEKESEAFDDEHRRHRDSIACVLALDRRGAPVPARALKGASVTVRRAPVSL